MTSENIEKEPSPRTAPIRTWRERSTSFRREGLQRPRFQVIDPGAAPRIPLRSTPPRQGETRKYGANAPDDVNTLLIRMDDALKRLEREGDTATHTRISEAKILLGYALHARDVLQTGGAWQYIYPDLDGQPDAQEQAEQICRKDLQYAVKDVTRLLDNLELNSGSATQASA